MRRGETPNDDLTRQERRVKALELRKAGKSYREIAFDLKCNVQTAFADVQLCIHEGRAGLSEDVKELERARYDRYLSVLEQNIGGGACPECGRSDVKVIEAALKVSKARRELDGMDAPTKTQAVEPEPVDDEDLLEQLAEAKAKVEARLAEKAQANGKVH